MSSQLIVMHVYVKVKPEAVEAFRAATIVNATESRKEPGIARFDVMQHAEDPTRFVLVEAYHDDQAPAAHKATAHYATWRDTVANMMAVPRTNDRFTNVDPPSSQW